MSLASMTRKRFITPPTLPTETQCRGLIIPASKEWLGVFSEALSATFYSHNYEQVNATDLTPDAVAALCYDIYLAWLDSACDGGECPPPYPNNQRAVRLNPVTKKWQQLADDGVTWEAPTGELAVPAQTARGENTDDEKLCMAARNAANVMKLLYAEALDLYENEIDPAAALDIWGEWAGEIIFEGLALLVSHFSPLVGYMWSTLYGIMELLTLPVWSTAFDNKLTCLFKENASVTNGVVTFDFDAIVTSMFTSGHTANTDLLLLGQVWYFLQIIGADGLNIAGETTGITSYTCGCGSWARKWEHWALTSGSEWALTRGVINANGNITPEGTWPDSLAQVTATITIPENTTIRSIEGWWYDPSGGGGAHWSFRGNGTVWVQSEYTTYHVDGYSVYTVNVPATSGVYTLTATLLGVRDEAYFKGLVIRGDGPCPFITGVSI